MYCKSGIPKLRQTVLVCALLTAVTAAQAALPVSGPGAFDPTFNAGTPILRSLGPGYTAPVVALQQPDGRVVVAGYGANPQNDGSASYVTRVLADGGADLSFAAGNALVFGDAANDIGIEQGMLAVDGRIWLFGESTVAPTINDNYVAWIARVNADGTPDSGFGAGGQRMVACGSNANCYYYGGTQQPDHAILIVGVGMDANYDNKVTFLDRYKSDGTLDAAYGSAGRKSLSMFPGFGGRHVAVDPSGRTIIFGYFVNPSTKLTQGMVVRLLADGSVDPSFGNAGAAMIDVPGKHFTSGSMIVLADGRLLLGGHSTAVQGTTIETAGRIVRLTANGVPDADFGNQGWVSFAPYGGVIGVQSDGRIVYAGQLYDAKAVTYRMAVERVLPDGQIDVSFGAGGVVYPYDAASVVSRGLAIGPDDRLVITASSRAQGSSTAKDILIARLIGSETTTNVVEFYNSNLNHYFITANPDEASAIDGGAAGPGWSRTGSAWKSGGPNRVCRFYGSPEIDPSTNKRKGPNGHFYTISADECALVKEDAGWKFESYDFSGWPKQADGTCAAGTVAVKRAYNNRFAVNDSNHRYTTSDAIYNQMAASGWSGEGTVFCAPQ